jgi:hypothetical protein
MRILRLLACTSLLATAACPGIAGLTERWERQPAYLVDDQEARVVVPAQVTAGAHFQVNITTYGGGCERQGKTEVSVSQPTRTADVTPYDETNVAAEVCTQELKMFSHTATVRFEQPGTAVVRVHGVRLQDKAPVTVTRTVEVVAAGS